MTVRLHSRRLAALGATVTTGPLARSRPWARVGSTRAERHATLAGDGVIDHPKLVATRAITIVAPAEAVWPWVAQLGQGRAGWHGDWQDDAGGPGADRLVPGLQHLAVGDVIADTVGPLGFHLVELIPGRAVVLRATIHPVTGKVVGRSRHPERPFIDCTWAFVLVPQTPERCRLVVRVRYDHSLHWLAGRAVDAYEVIDALFARRMLVGMRERAEGGGIGAPAPPPEVAPAGAGSTGSARPAVGTRSVPVRGGAT